MSKVASWHSPERDVFHNNDQCKEGEHVEPHNRVEGPSDKRLCKRCEALNLKEEKVRQEI
jgi:hypothetical protein